MAGTHTTTEGAASHVTIRDRLLAVLEFDGIPQSKRARHLAEACCCSVATGRRMLTEIQPLERRLNRRLFKIARGLDVHWRWLYDGKFERFNARTALIELVAFKGEERDDARAIIESVSAPVPGEPDYVAVCSDGISLSSVLLVEQHRRLTDWEKNKNIRFMIRLANNDPKADRLLEMYSKGQISRQQIFNVV